MQRSEFSIEDISRGRTMTYSDLAEIASSYALCLLVTSLCAVISHVVLRISAGRLTPGGVVESFGERRTSGRGLRRVGLRGRPGF